MSTTIDRSLSRYRIGPFVLDVSRGELRRDGDLVPLQPRVYGLLIYLLDHAGAICSKDELLLAVWKTPHVTDAVLATAMRKLRQALGDSDGDTAMVKTVHGRGYRLDADVEQLPADTGRLPAAEISEQPPLTGGLLLPKVADRTEDPALSWVGIGLTCLMHARLGQRTGLRLVPLDTSLQWRPAPGDTTAASQLHRLGASQGLICSLSRVGRRLQMDADYVDQGGIQWQWRQPGSDPAAMAVELADGLVEWLTQTAPPGTPTQLGTALGEGTLSSSGDEAMFWLRELGRAMALERLGQVELALQVLESCLPHLGDDPEVALFHARVLRQRHVFAAALEVVSRALVALPAHDLNMRARLLTELATVHHCKNDFDAAQRESEAAIALCAQADTSPDSLCLALLLAATLDLAQEDFRGAANKARQAHRTAMRCGDPVVQVRALWLIFAATFDQGDLDGCKLIMDEALAVAEQSGLVLLRAEVYVRNAYYLDLRFEHAAAVELARRAVRLAQEGSDLTLAYHVRTREVLSLCSAGRAADAQAAFEQLRAMTSPQAASRSQFTLLRALAAVHWTCGRASEAIRVTEQILQGLSPSDLYRRRGMLEQLGNMLLSTGDRQRAMEMFAPVLETVPPLVLARINAALALAAGDRRRATAMLASACATQPLGEGDGWSALASLMWLLAEDGGAAAVAHLEPELAAAPIGHQGLALLRAMLDLRSGRVPFDLTRWQQLVRANPGLVHRHAWLLDATETLQWLAGGPRRLDELFALAWS